MNSGYITGISTGKYTARWTHSLRRYILEGESMSKGYWIVRADVTDIDKFKEYASKTPRILEKFGGRFLVRAGQFRLVEGSTRSRNTVIEFPSYESALQCWESNDYQDAKKHRVDGGELDIVVIEGCNA
ncbi:MAG: hypothetical protein ACJA0N_002378 [Pseudohongiellaceae bacterium]|jgi:uncharacterized protein (DUF1330 family)